MIARSSDGVRLPFKPLSEIEPLPDGEQWLVEGFMTRASLTVLAATPKTGKTWVGLSLATAVASGTLALSHFHVPRPGRVLIFPAEDDVRAVRGRIESLCSSEDLALDELPIDLITADQLKLDDPEQRGQLEELLEHRRPDLLVLDPLVRLHSGAESYAGHVAELFGYLRALQRRFDLAVVVTHHVAKNRSKGAQPGQAMRGSGDIHAAYDHGAMLHRESDGSICLQLEHRVAESPDPLFFRLVSKQGGGTVFEVLDRDPAEEEQPSRSPRPSRPRVVQSLLPLEEQVVQLLERAGGPVSQVAMRRALKVRNENLTAVLHGLVRSGQLEHLGRMKGWKLLENGEASSA